jgi:hypothetical protein
MAHADIAAGAADVLDDEGLAGGLLKRRSDNAADQIGWSARRIGNDDLDRAIGIGGESGAIAEESRSHDTGGKRPFDDVAAGERKDKFGFHRRLYQEFHEEFGRHARRHDDSGRGTWR